ncbi:alkene reductase [Phycicoccus sp. BSK3Z-2]|uniref:Alkene reductase n=1 Tax=Phycicoccus avicenniae TaxID=2828860 RepID=A0A941D7C9_9MICO|nr:alkene reductase [Phycicoccus avicenniae]MBR7741872.1 alkene reductase [Phycicoccus avicenniae]
MTTLFDTVNTSIATLPNRIVMAPMTRARSDGDGLASASMATYYAQRAGAGLIVSEGIWPSRLGQSNPMTPGLTTEAQVRSWRQVTSAVHAAGGRIVAQIQHAGRLSHPDTTGQQPVGPSAVAARDVMMFTPAGPQPAPAPRALTTDEAADEAASFGPAARAAIEAGFDGVEVHGANGYLVSQFLASNANLRTDRYGGSVEARTRFAVEAVAAAVEAVGAERVGIRLSPGAGIQDAVDTDVTELYTTLLTRLSALGLAYVHLEEGTDEDTLLRLRDVWPGTLVMNPSVPTATTPAGLDDAERWLGHGADLISFGRAFIANPELVERLRTGSPLAVADDALYYMGGDDGYITYPTSGGPAGLTA